MVTTTRIFKYPSLPMPVIQTALDLLSLGEHQDEFVIKTLSPVLSKAFLEQVRLVLETSLPISTGCSSVGGGKKQKTQAVQREPLVIKLLEKKWKALLACNPPDSESFENLKRRARVATVQSLFFYTAKLFQTGAPLFEMTMSYLDVQELCRTSACSTELNYELSLPNPRIWHAVSRTFAFETEIYWPEYSRNQARINYELAGRINATFCLCCRNPSLSEMVRTFSGVAHLPGPRAFREELGRRAVFSRTVKPIVSAISQNNRNKRTLLPSKYLHDLLGVANIPLAHSFPLRVLEMFFACGERGTRNTFELFCEKYSSFDPPSSAGKSNHEEVVFQILDKLSRYGVAPQSINCLLEVFRDMLKPSLIPVALRLLDQSNADDDSLFNAARAGATELLEPLITKGLAKISYHEFGYLVLTLINSVYAPENAEEVIRAIDLVLNKGLRATRDKYDTASLLANMPELDSEFDLFYLAATQYLSNALMEKLISLGLRPHNSPDKENTLKTALTEKLYLTSEGTIVPEMEPHYQLILFLCKHGAKPPRDVESLIEKNYSSIPELEIAMRKLLYPKSLKAPASPPPTSPTETNCIVM